MAVTWQSQNHSKLHGQTSAYRVHVEGVLPLAYGGVPEFFSSLLNLLVGFPAVV